MSYQLSRYLSPFPCSVEIDENHFQRIDLAQKRLLKARSIEENYMFLIQNYGDFEKILMSIVIDKILFEDTKDNYLLNRSVLNLFGTWYLYFQHLRDDAIKEMYNLENLTKKILEEPEVKIVTALRNYSQHQDIPFRESYFCIQEGRWDIKAVVNVEELERNENFVKCNKHGLEAMRNYRKDKEGNIDGIELIRHAMARTNEFHEELRKDIKNDLIESEQIVKQAIDFFISQSEFRGDDWRTGIKAIKKLNPDKEEFYLSEKCIEVYKDIQKIFKPPTGAMKFSLSIDQSQPKLS